MISSRYFGAFVHDLLAATLAFALALYARLGVEIMAVPLRETATAFTIYLVTCAMVFHYFGLHKGVWRYTSLQDLTQIIRATLCCVVGFVAFVFLFTRAEAVPRSAPIIILFTLPCLLAGSRISYRLLRERRLSKLWQPTGNSQDVLLVGAGDEAEMFIRRAGKHPASAFRVVGVIDDKDKAKRVGRTIHNVPVLGGVDDMPKIVSTLQADGKKPCKLIITRAPNTYDSATLRELISHSNALDLPLARLPSTTELRNSLESDPPIIKQVAIEDLLGRPEVQLNRSAIENLIKGRRVLITGAGGTIGSELARQISALGPSLLVLVENSEYNLYSIDQELADAAPTLPRRSVLADVRDRARIEAIFLTEQPEIIFHAAALKHVPMAEANVREAVLTNVCGSQNVADAAQLVNARAMVMISTDKAINPTNIMGATKRIAESYCQTLDQSSAQTRFMTVRFGNVLGSSGSVVPLFKKQLERGGPLTVTHAEVTRYFMTVREAVELVLQASAHGLATSTQRGKIFVLDMGQPIKIIDLARQMIRLAGLRPDEDIKIAITGLRPGEKLYEELFSDQEKYANAGVDGVLVASPAHQPLAALQQAITQLITDARQQSEQPNLVQQIQALVPEYQRAEHATIAA